MADVNISVYDVSSITENTSEFVIQNGLIVSVPFFNSGIGTGIASFTCSRASSVTGIDTNGQIVTYGSNELSFNRGMLQKNPASGYTNLLEYSEDFTQWINSNTTDSADLIGPDGVVNSGTTLTATSANGTIKYTINGASASQDYCFSIWMRRISGTGDVDLTDDNGNTWTTKTLTTEWQEFYVTQSHSNPIVGIRLVDNGDSIGIFGGNLTASSYPLPYVATSGTTGTVAAETISADISSNPTLTDVLGNGMSVGTLLFYLIPKYDDSLLSGLGTIGFISVSGNQYSLAYTGYGTTAARIYSNDGSGSCNYQVGWGINDIIIVAVRWSDSTSLKQVSTSTDGGYSWNHGSTAVYDGAYVISSTTEIGWSQEFPFLIQNLRIYDSWIADADLSKAAGFEQVSVNETSSITELIASGMSDLEGSSYDLTSIAENVSNSLESFISSFDSSALSEYIKEMLEVLPGVYDSIGVVENYPISFESFISSYDSSVITEFTKENLICCVSAYNTTTLSEVTFLSFDSIISVYDGITTTEVVSTAEVCFISINEELSLADSPVLTNILTISKYETAELLEYFNTYISGYYVDGMLEIEAEPLALTIEAEAI